MTLKQIFNTSAELDYPTVLPTLDLDFANTKTLDPRITFTRSSGGSYVGADGLIKYAGVNEPRFDHDPVTGESLGLLVEEARTNLITRSISTGWVAGTAYSGGALPTGWEIDQGQPGTQLQIVGGGIENGINYVDLRFFGTNTLGNRWLIRPGNIVTLTAGVTYTSSVYAKLISGSISGSIGAINCQFSVVGGSFGAPLTGTNTNRLTRYFGAFTATSTGTYYPRLDVGSQVIGNTYDFTIRIAGFQAEVGAFPTSYIPTVASARTRSADVAQITGTNFSSWYRQDEGTFYYEGITQPGLSLFPTEWSVHDGTDVNVIGAYNSTNAYGCAVRKSGSPNTDPVLTLTPVSGTPFKKAIAIKASDFRVSAQGRQGATTNPAFVPTVTDMRIGADRNGLGSVNTTISRLTYWPKRLPNAQLRTLTTV